jgi:hypothetical protein
VTEDGVEALTPSSSSMAIESEEAVESVQGLENEEIDPTLGTIINPSLPIVCLEY